LKKNHSLKFQVMLPEMNGKDAYMETVDGNLRVALSLT